MLMLSSKLLHSHGIDNVRINDNINTEIVAISALIFSQPMVSRNSRLQRAKQHPYQVLVAINSSYQINVLTLLCNEVIVVRVHARTW